MEETKSPLQDFHDDAVDKGWRIPLIPFDDSVRPMYGVLKNKYVLIGVFICFCSYLIPGKLGDYVGVAGIVTMVAGVILPERFKRRGWVKTEAICADREVRCSYNGRYPSWKFRALCQFGLQGKNYSVTPNYWLTFTSKRSLENFLTKNIHSDGRCFLYINPKNPLQTDIAAKGMADKLIH